jgi:predicted  nucleic acid-binding Zn-ribbon protein
MDIQARIDQWQKKIGELEKQYTDNKDGDIYGKRDMVENMGKNLSRIEKYHADYSKLEGAEAIEVKNQMEAYFINLELIEKKLDKELLQR